MGNAKKVVCNSIEAVNIGKQNFGELLVICQIRLKFFTANVFLPYGMQLDTLSFHYTLDIEDLNPNIACIITFHYTSRIIRRPTCYALLS